MKVKKKNEFGNIVKMAKVIYLTGKIKDDNFKWYVDEHNMPILSCNSKLVCSLINKFNLDENRIRAIIKQNEDDYYKKQYSRKESNKINLERLFLLSNQGLQ